MGPLFDDSALVEHDDAVASRCGRDAVGDEDDRAFGSLSLHRLENRGHIKGVWETAESGRRRRCYKLTSEGRKKLSPIRKEWDELFRALRRLTKVSRA